MRAVGLVTTLFLNKLKVQFNSSVYNLAPMPWFELLPISAVHTRKNIEKQREINCEKKFLLAAALGCITDYLQLSLKGLSAFLSIFIPFCYHQLNTF